MSALITWLMIGIWGASSFYNFALLMKYGVQRLGKIGRYLGPHLYSTVQIFLMNVTVIAFILRLDAMMSAVIAFNFIVAADNFINGDGPPRKRRRHWLSMKLRRLLPIGG